MDCSDHLSSVAHRSGHAFYRAGAHVAHGEDAAAAGFERQAGLRNVGARQDEPAAVQAQSGIR